MRIEHRDGAENLVSDDVLSQLISLAKTYKGKLEVLKKSTDLVKTKINNLMAAHKIKSVADDGISISWSPKSSQRRLSRDRIIEVFTANGVPVDEIDGCYETYERSEVVTIKKK